MFSACKTTNKTQAISTVENSEKFFTLYRGACYGQCPSFKIYINPDGSFNYYGKSYVDNIGKFEGILSKEQVDNLFNKLTTYNWAEYLTEYPVDNVDFPSFKIEYGDGKHLKTIKGNSNAPKELIELTKSIDLLIKNLKMVAVE